MGNILLTHKIQPVRHINASILDTVFSRLSPEAKNRILQRRGAISLGDAPISMKPESDLNHFPNDNNRPNTS